MAKLKCRRNSNRSFTVRKLTRKTIAEEHNIRLYQIQSFVLVNGAVKTTINNKGMVGVYGKGQLGVRFLRGSMCTEGMGCKRRLVRCVLRGTGTASGHP